ncbi:MAG TPA: zf-HC2 domain-containing protein [Streptosporangiaceae bacterium]
MSTEHTDVAAYSLGLLDQQDRQAFEDHLAACPSCAAELAELSGMAELLTGVEPVPAAGDAPDEAEIVDLVRRRAAAQRRHTRWQVAASVAAGVALIAGGVAVGVATSRSPAPATPPATVALQGQRHSATDPVTGVAGTIGLVSKAWGTQVTLDLSKVRGPLECQLVAVSKAGQRRVMVGWLVPAAGYGVPGHPAHLLLEGGTSIPKGELSRILVNVVGGRTLLSIPV